MHSDSNKFFAHAEHIVSLLAGNALLAFCVAAFVIPHNILMGGATGIGIVTGRALRIDPAAVVLVFNLLMLALGRVTLGHKFLLSTVASSLLYPLFLAAMQRIPGIDSMTDDPLLATLFAGVLLGAALGIVMRVGASTGGVDVLNLCMHKWLHWPVSVCVWLCDFLVLGGQALFSDGEAILYGILALILESIVLDRVMLLGKAQLQIFAVTQHYAVLRRRLLTELHTGVTMVNIETGCLGETQQGILCVISPRRLHAVTELLQSVDPHIFMTVTQIREVRGRGFTSERRWLYPDLPEDDI